MIVGAGPAGLAVGACLSRLAVPFVILERGTELAPSWRRHYDRLRLHTDKWTSSLPHRRFPRSYPRYPSRQQVIAYLEDYACHFGLRPLLNQEVKAIRPGDGGWETEAADRIFVSRNVVVATGNTCVPHWPSWAEAGSYEGMLLHSVDYRNGEPFSGKSVLVVGLGNSGGEIAIDLYEHGAKVAIAVRGPVSVVPRDLLGLPITALAILLRRLPPQLADHLSAPLLRLTIGDLTRLGLDRPACGPLQQIAERERIPLIDVGTLQLIRRGAIGLRPGVCRLARGGVVFADGSEEDFDAVVLATGYRTGLEKILACHPELLGPEARPRSSLGEDLPKGLYLCGFAVPPSGVLREIAREARSIAQQIADQSF